MQKISRTTKLIQTADDGIFGSSNQNPRPHCSLSLTGIPPLHPFMTLPSQAFPATYAIQNLRTMRQCSSVYPPSTNATQQAVDALRRAYLGHNLNWSPALHLSSSAGLYANAAVSNARWSSPLTSLDDMSQILMSQRRISPHFPLSYEARLLSASAEPPRTPSSPTSTSRGLQTDVNQKRSFPMILHKALQELDRRPGGSDVAAFLPDGRSFCIKDQQKFADLVLPVFFPKMKGFASLQRQLNLYDFKRVGGMGPDRGCYRHGLFHRDFPGDMIFMKRRKIKGPYKA